MHEGGELGSGDEGVRVSLVKEERELVAIEVIQRNQIGFVLFHRESLYSRRV